MILVDPSIDYVNKRLFETPELLVHFLNAVLGLAGDRRIEAVEILNPFVLGETEDEKYSILDIRAQDAAGRRFNVEMQFRLPPALAGRLLYYWSGMFREQLDLGEEYVRLQPTYVICILNGAWRRETPRWHLA